MSKATASSHFTSGRHLPCSSERSGCPMSPKATSAGVCDDPLAPMQTLGTCCGSQWGRTCLPAFPPGYLSLTEEILSFTVKVRMCPSSLQILGWGNQLCGWQALRTEGCESHSKPNPAMGFGLCHPLERVQSQALCSSKDITLPFLF